MTDPVPSQVEAPSAAPAPAPAAGGPPRRSRPLAIYVLALVGVLVVALVVIGALAPDDPPPTCSGDVTLCPDPPGGDGGTSPTFQPIATGPSGSTAPGPAAAPFLPGTTWKSTDLGFEVRYDAQKWQVARESAHDLVLVPTQELGFWVLFEGASATDASVQALIDQRVDLIDDTYTGFEVDDEPYSAILGSHIGFVDAVGASYIGTGTGSDGLPLTPSGFAILGATDGRVVMVFTMGVANPDQLRGGDTRQAVYRGRGDTLLEDFSWGP